jgi:L-aminopeptidase/D-esterase-like protein
LYNQFWSKRNFTVAGVPVGIELKDTLNYIIHAPPTSRRQEGDGSIMVIIATDMPLLPHN